ncbi:hypothetical protein Q3G72_007837 [Acer saccharum]|nr:hypothetical protein Q3G72_007837 [Acer saccharum]
MELNAIKQAFLGMGIHGQRHLQLTSLTDKRFSGLVPGELGLNELLPNEVPTIEKRKVKKAQEKKPSIVVIQGPKPAALAPSKDAKTSDVATPSQNAVAEVVAAA